MTYARTFRPGEPLPAYLVWREDADYEPEAFAHWITHDGVAYVVAEFPGVWIFHPASDLSQPYAAFAEHLGFLRRQITGEKPPARVRNGSARKPRVVQEAS